MSTELESRSHRYGAFAERILGPASITHTVPLEIGVHQSLDPIPVGDSNDLDYRAVETGWRWGPRWSNAWFRLRGRIDDRLTERPIGLRFSSGTEALLWEDGVPRHAFDANHDLYMLPAPVPAPRDVEFQVEAACNLNLGVTTFWWDEAELQRRWTEAKPGRLDHAALVVFDESLWRLATAFDFAREVLALETELTPRARTLVAAMDGILADLDPGEPGRIATSGYERLGDALRGASETRTPACVAAGHAHIDTAWLWTLRETRRKCQRTFATALRLLERFPDFHFLCSQAQHYAWIEEDAPALFDQIRTRVQEGRWEPTGAMWIEPDANLISGESFIRQILHGVRYWEDRFGSAAPQRILYLPDTFGFMPCLPQIMKLSGIDTFITNKLSWSQVNEFPYVTFRWRGLDGSEVLSHCTPGHDYNAKLSAEDLARGGANMGRKDALIGTYLQPFGFGDGGGGPTAEMIERARLAGACEGLPAVQMGRANDLAEELHRRCGEARENGHDIPVWDGELYLELHRGTYTSQAGLKRANRRAEEALRRAEWLSVCAPEPVNRTVVRDRLDEAWKLVLLNQFHDILPGTSIAPVYDDARAQHETVRLITDAVQRDALDVWRSNLDGAGLTEPVVVVNPTSHHIERVVTLRADRHALVHVPPMSARVVDAATAGGGGRDHVRVEGHTLENGVIRVTLDDAGRVGTLDRIDGARTFRHRANAPDEDGHPLPLNQLMLYEDNPRAWDAWDVDPEYVERAVRIAGPCVVEVVTTDPLVGEIRCTRDLGQSSRISQTYRLEARSPRLDIITEVDWHERHRFLRALFPVNVRSRFAVYDVPFGCLERPTHRNTSWERARFEVCAHRWMDVSEPSFGVAILNDGKYGHSCVDNVMGLSLLRAPTFPDPECDQGRHRFTYSIYPHHGDWRNRVMAEAATINDPLLVAGVPTGDTAMTEWRPLDLEAEDAGVFVEIVAVKPAERDDRIIVRLVEPVGGRGHAVISWNLRVRDVEPVDLLERPLQLAGFRHESGRTHLDVRPFQIITLAVTLDHEGAKTPRL